MDMQLARKIVFISGSTQGIGYAVGEAAAKEGASVILNGRWQETVDVAVAKLRSAVPNADVSGVAADFSDPIQVDEFVRVIGPVDVLVNNVGVFYITSFDQVDDREWLLYFQVNVMSAVRLARGLLGGMIERNWERIISIGTESAIDIPDNMIHYGSTKAAGLALNNGLAKLTKGTEVTMNTVLGGPTYSDGVAHAVQAIASAQGIDSDNLKASLVRDRSLIGRFIEPEEIANLVVFLASPRSSATNGSTIRADGGVLPTIL